MNKHLSIKIWERVAEFRIEEPELQEEELWCGYAREFYEWIDEWIIPVEFELISINQAKFFCSTNIWNGVALSPRATKITLAQGDISVSTMPLSEPVNTYK